MNCKLENRKRNNQTGFWPLCLLLVVALLLPTPFAQAQWNDGPDGSIFYRGKVGIGTNNPSAQLDVVGDLLLTNKTDDATTKYTTIKGGHYSISEKDILYFWGIALENMNLLRFGADHPDLASPTQFEFYTAETTTSAGTKRMVIKANGNVGIGLNNPGERLDIDGYVQADGFKFPDQSVQTTAYTGSTSSNSLDALDGEPTNAVWVDDVGNVGIGNGSATIPSTAKLYVNGQASVNTLEIRGGSDLAEWFDVEGDVVPGIVASIDPIRPGKLRVSHSAYDRTVVGVVSGANGVKTGLTLGQADTLANGEHAIAMTGRVYVYADANNGPIVPGDLLTTSNTPGHVMKVTDHNQAIGAILGKAMTALEDDLGMVLMVVALQ